MNGSIGKLIHKKALWLLLFGVLAAFLVPRFIMADAATDSLITYPDYPEQIGRNTDYAVKVTQGSVTKNLVVYNATRTGGEAAEGDMYRRFAEFAFEGGPVTVEVTVNAYPLNSYQVLPTSKHYPATAAGDKITVTISQPGAVVIRVNDNQNSILTIFADRPETEIPDKNNPNVLFYEAGWHEVAGDHILQVTQGQTLYLAPGAVLSGRVTINGGGIGNVTVRGRGILLDGVGLKQDFNKQMLYFRSGTNYLVKDIKILDSNWYNIVFSVINGATIDNVKIMSNQVNSDGITTWGGCRNITVQNSFIYNSDSCIVLSGSTPTNLVNNILVKDSILSSTTAVFQPIADIGPNVRFQNIDVFRSGSSLIVNNYPNNAQTSMDNITFEDIRANDSRILGNIMLLENQGSPLKSIILKNVSVPGNPIINIKSTGGNYNISYENVWYNNTLITTPQNAGLQDLGTPKSTVTTLSGSAIAPGDWGSAPINNPSPATPPAKVRLDGQFMVFSGALEKGLNNEVLIPFHSGIFEKMGGTEVWNEAGQSLTIARDSNTVTLTVGLKSATVNGIIVPLDQTFAIDKIPLGFVTHSIGGKATWKPEISTLDIVSRPPLENVEILKNGGFEDSTLNLNPWQNYSVSKIKLVTTPVHSGAQAACVYVRTADWHGLRQQLETAFNENGTGTYKAEAWARVPSGTANAAMVIVVKSGGKETFYKTVQQVDDKGWTKLSFSGVITWTGALEGARIHFETNTPSGTPVPPELYVDDVSLMKINVSESTAPIPPTDVAARILEDGSAEVSFVPPASDGGEAIVSYTVTSDPDAVTATGTASPIVVHGLTPGRTYTFSVVAANKVGSSQKSVASGSVAVPEPAVDTSALNALYDTWKTVDSALYTKSSWNVFSAALTEANRVLLLARPTQPEADAAYAALLQASAGLIKVTATPTPSPTPAPSANPAPTLTPTPASEPVRDIVKASELEAAIAFGKDYSIEIKDGAGKVKYEWTFTKQNLKKADDNTLTDIKLGLEVNKLEADKAIDNLLTKQDKKAAGLIIGFEHEGILPVQATVKVYVGGMGLEKGQKVYLYHYNTASGKLEALPNSSFYKVDDSGYITIDIVHCSDYVVLSKEADTDTCTSLSDQIKISAKNLKLYTGDSKYGKASIRVTLPATLELVHNLKSETSGNASGTVTLTFRSSNSKVAAVTDSGIVTAKGNGSAKITVVATLNNGETKIFTTAVTVKEPGIKISESTAAMELGSTYTFSASVEGYDKNNIVWMTSKRDIVVISRKTGRAVAKTAGTDYVEARIDNKIVRVKVVVK